MAQRSNFSDVPEPKLVERSPLINPRKLRSCRSLSRSASVVDSQTFHRASSTKPYTLQPVSEIGQQRPLTGQYTLNHHHALNRSQSAPHPLRSAHFTTPAAQHLRSPQYRVNPVVKFDNRVFPERMNYGIAGYNTSRPRSFSSIPETATSRPSSFNTIPESPRAQSRSFSSGSGSTTRRRSFSSGSESATRPRSSLSRSNQTPGPATRAVIWRSLTRRFRDKMGRIRVRDTCSKLLSRFRG